MKLSRRTLLSTVATSALFGNSLSAQVNRGEKSVIWLWLGGGISATELINPIPDGPVEYRSVTGAIDTTGDYQLGGNFEYLARIGHKLTPVRSFAHTDASHGSATGWVMTGKPMVSGEGSPQTDPSHGSMVSSLLGSNKSNGIPSYVKINGIQYDGSVWLGSQHIGFEADGEGVKNLKPSIELDKFSKRMDIVKSLDKMNQLNFWSTMRDQAYSIVAGEANRAFDIKREAPQVLDKYRVNKSNLGRSLLLARRLVQAGSKFVTIHHGGWDMHADIKNGFDNLAPDVDYSLYTLIEELESFDMLSNTLIVVTSEFSRTPKLNKGLVGFSDIPGRDHWPGLVPLILIGGEYDRGSVIGTTNKLAEYPTSSPFGPKDITNTVFDHFGLDKHTVIYDTENRPRHLVSDESRLIA